MKKFVGPHVSIAGGVENAPRRAAEVGAKAFAIFTKNQRQWQAPPLSEESVSLFRQNLSSAGIQPRHVLPHDGYLINLGNPDEGKRRKAVNAFIDEAHRVEALGLSLFNFHPGSHLRQIDERGCMALIAEGVKKAMAATQDVVFVLETTAGQGTNIGYNFEQLAYMLELIDNEKRTGVCLDTCHIFAAGYDLVNAYPRVMERFKAVIGRQMLKAVHLNDCKSALGQKLDRHHSLGAGNLGWDVFRTIMQDPLFDDIPLILETIDDSLWPEEIRRLYGFLREGST